MQEEERAVLLATAAESAQRYDEMKYYMRERVEKGGPLNIEERDLLSAAFKAALNQRRHAAHVAKTVQEYEDANGHADNVELASGYRTKMESELQEICQEAVSLLKRILIPRAEVGEPKTFYLKMQGDYHRYSAEGSRGLSRAKAAEDAKTAYTAATQEAQQHLLTTHPVRLSLAVNFSVFQHEVLSDDAAAIEIANKALQSARADMDSIPEEAHSDAVMTMQILRDNLEMWSPPPDD